MARKKTNEEFTKEVRELVEDEYVFLDKYIKSSVKIRCIHNKCEHIWKITPNDFLSGYRCPKCAGNIKKTNAQFIVEIHDLVGENYVFLDEYINAKTKIRCRHCVCGHEWNVAPSSFLGGSRCPKCNTNKLMYEDIKHRVEVIGGTECKLLSKEYTGIDQKLKLQCKCGEVFYATYSHIRRRNKTICNSCSAEEISKSTRKSNKDFIQDVYDLVGDKYVFLEKYINSRTEILCKHNKCKHEWYTTPNSFLSGYGCPECNQSKGEIQVSGWLDSRNVDYLIEYKYKDCKNIEPLAFDFYVPKYNTLVEFDGKQHFEPIEWFGGLADFEYRKQNDNIKNQYCKDNNIPLLRIPYWDFDNIEQILENWLGENNQE